VLVFPGEWSEEKGPLTCLIAIFEDQPDKFSALFRRILTLLLDPTWSSAVRTHLLCFLISAFQSLDSPIVRKECVPLVSIGIWHNLSSDEAREEKLGQHSSLRKVWRASLRRSENADDEGKARLRFERSWLYSLVLDYLGRLQVEGAEGMVSEITFSLG
jgi:intron-binding protein aquarius